MMNEGLKYLKDILSEKLYNTAKYGFHGNQHFIVHLSLEQAFKIVMEINEVEENAKQNN